MVLGTAVKQQILKLILAYANWRKPELSSYGISLMSEQNDVEQKMMLFEELLYFL